MVLIDRINLCNSSMFSSGDGDGDVAIVSDWI